MSCIDVTSKGTGILMDGRLQYMGQQPGSDIVQKKMSGQLPAGSIIEINPRRRQPYNHSFSDGAPLFIKLVPF
jgi:hypothetical protein